MATKYLVALVSVTLAVLNALQTALASSGLDVGEVAQLVAILAGATIAFVVPLIAGPWRGALKTGAAIVAAVAAALAPLLLTGTITPEQWVTVVIAGVNVLATEIGVQIRTDAVQSALRAIDGTEMVADPRLAESRTRRLAVHGAVKTLTTDPAAVRAVTGQDVNDLLRLIAA